MGGDSLRGLTGVYVLTKFNAQTTSKIYHIVGELFSTEIVNLPKDKSARIVIKPNLNSNMNALTGNTTDLRLLYAVIITLKEKGYNNITIAEGYAGGFHREGINVIERLRVDVLCKLADVKLVNANFCEDTTEVKFENGTVARIARIFTDNDFFINIPKIKTHTETVLSCCCKSLIGCLAGQENKKKVHESLFKNIIHLNRTIRPQLYIVDGIISMEGNGPTTGTPKKTGIILAGDNPWLLDLVVSRLIGIEDFSRVPVLKEAKEQGLIEENMLKVRSEKMWSNSLHLKLPRLSFTQKVVTDQRWQKHLQKIRHAPVIEQICSLQSVRNLMFNLKLTQEVFKKEEPVLESIRLDRSRCINCKKCEEYCPTGLSPYLTENVSDNPGCIKCLYCYSVCPSQSITVQGSLGFFEEQEKQYGSLIKESL